MSLDFTYNLMEKFVPMTLGMDLTEVNFELTSGEVRRNDEQTFRELFEFICHQVNKPTDDELDIRYKIFTFGGKIKEEFNSNTMIAKDAQKRIKLSKLGIEDVQI